METDVCVVGAGPAGLSLCRELAGRRIETLLLESGGFEWNTRLQALNRGSRQGDPYADLSATRHRGVGGTANLWNTGLGDGSLGAKYVPLDPRDLLGAADVEGAWPFGAAELEPFYRRARPLCGLGARTDGGTSQADELAHVWQLPACGLRTGVYQLGPARRWTAEVPGEIRAAEHAVLCVHATATRLELDEAGTRVLRIHAVVPRGPRLSIHPQRVVLAAGAIENARLLLASTVGAGPAPGNASGWLGRCFMEHPRDYSLRLEAGAPNLLSHVTFFEAHVDPGGSRLLGRLAPASASDADECAVNYSVSLLPRWRWGAREWLARLRARLPGREPAGPMPVAGHAPACDGFRVVINLEQRPDPANRITLDRATDRFGVPRPVLHWRWSATEQAGLERLRTWLAERLAAAGLGRVEIRPGVRPDPNAHHHAGTTRMHPDPGRGVVDADGRVHGTENLFLTGASVFPSAGYANPTLTIVALALRLADHLAAAR